MLTNKTTFRVRYGETDQMGIVNNAVYPSWFEMGRTEMFCEINLPYGEMEKTGLLLPVAELYVKYHSPAYYEDILTITTSIQDIPASRVILYYEIHNNEKKLIASGHTVHAFLDSATRRPVRAPQFLKELLQQYI